METEARILRSSSTRAIVGMSRFSVSGGPAREAGSVARTTPVQPVCAQNVAESIEDSPWKSQFINSALGLVDGSPISSGEDGAAGVARILPLGRFPRGPNRPLDLAPGRGLEKDAGAAFPAPRAFHRR